MKKLFLICFLSSLICYVTLDATRLKVYLRPRSILEACEEIVFYETIPFILFALVPTLLGTLAVYRFRRE